MLKCKICGTEFPAVKERHYVARDNTRTGAVAVISKDEEKVYDAYDCPMCGSQIIAQERKRNFEPDDNEKMEDEEKMLNFNLDSVESANKLIRLCEKCRDEMELDIDVTHGRQTVDGCSLLGVTSLIGRFVTVVPNTTDKEMLQKFAEELEMIKR